MQISQWKCLNLNFAEQLKITNRIWKFLEQKCTLKKILMCSRIKETKVKHDNWIECCAIKAFNNNDEIMLKLLSSEYKILNNERKMITLIVHHKPKKKTYEEYI